MDRQKTTGGRSEPKVELATCPTPDGSARLRAAFQIALDAAYRTRVDRSTAEERTEQRDHVGEEPSDDAQNLPGT